LEIIVDALATKVSPLIVVVEAVIPDVGKRTFEER
jgi:hypothetical protein